MISVAEAQQNSNTGFYVKIFGGYGFLTPGSFKLTSTSGTSFSIGSTALGEGVHYGGGVGYVLNDLLNLGVDVDYLNGKKLAISSSFVGLPGNAKSNNTINYSILSIIPNVTFKAIAQPTYLIYTRIGIIITANTKSNLSIYDSSNLTYNSPTHIIALDSNVNFTYNVNVGVQAALGVQFKITDNIRGFGEIAGYFLAITPSNSTNTGTRRYYNPAPDGSSTNSQNYTYKDSGDFTKNELPASSYNTNSIGINIGIAYRFGQ
jgi:hypothetical protein